VLLALWLRLRSHHHVRFPLNMFQFWLVVKSRSAHSIILYRLKLLTINREHFLSCKLFLKLQIGRELQFTIVEVRRFEWLCWFNWFCWLVDDLERMHIVIYLLLGADWQTILLLSLHWQGLLLRYDLLFNFWINLLSLWEQRFFIFLLFWNYYSWRVQVFLLL
jgi:hypothetical protein